MGGVPALAAHDASRQGHQAVEQERREDDQAELDGQSAAADADVAEQSSGPAKLKPRKVLPTSPMNRRAGGRL